MKHIPCRGLNVFMFHDSVYWVMLIQDEGSTIYGFELGNKKDLVDLLTALCNNPNKINSLKQNCLIKATEFSASKAAERLKKLLS